MIWWMVAFCAVLRVTVMTSPPPSATGPEKLMTWVRENSEVFIMLKHWNELPLISTAWKRLRDTPAVVEDRRAFIDSFQALIEPLTNNVQHQQRNKSLNITECTDCSAAVPEPTSPSPAPETIKTEAPLTEDSTLTTETSDFDATTTRDSNQSNGTDMNSSISNFQPVADNNSTNVLQPQDCSLHYKACVDDFQEEKKWIRSQLIPLNYLFDKLKDIETAIEKLKGAHDRSSVNICSSPKTDSEQPDPKPSTQDSSGQILNKEIDKFRTEVFENINATKKELAQLRTKLDELANMRMSGLNGTEEGEYCPDRLDEMVPCSEVGDSCYCFSKQQKNWTDALEFCQKNNMFLLSLETEKEMELVTSHIKQSGLPKDFYWTSGSDEAEEGNWVWVSSQQNVTYNKWRTNQPDGGRKENCLYLHSRDDFKWGDWMCNLPQHFICEW